MGTSFDVDNGRQTEGKAVPETILLSRVPLGTSSKVVCLHGSGNASAFLSMLGISRPGLPLDAAAQASEERVQGPGPPSPFAGTSSHSRNCLPVVRYLVGCLHGEGAVVSMATARASLFPR